MSPTIIAGELNLVASLEAPVSGPLDDREVDPDVPGLAWQLDTSPLILGLLELHPPCREVVPRGPGFTAQHCHSATDRSIVGSGCGAASRAPGAGSPIRRRLRLGEREPVSTRRWDPSSLCGGTTASQVRRASRRGPREAARLMVRGGRHRSRREPGLGTTSRIRSRSSRGRRTPSPHRPRTTRV
jgi:hypothetical protein